MLFQTRKQITYNICSLCTADFYIAGYEDIITDIGFSLEFYPTHWIYDSNAYLNQIHQLNKFSEGNRTHLDIDFEIDAKGFKKEVLEQISKIPYGETRSYKEIAIMSGSPNAARAVGNVCRGNRILMAIPCHRVVASNGIGGYGEHIEVKKWLLEIENLNTQG